MVLPVIAKLQLGTLCGALFANAFAMSNPFPYAAFMVVHFGMTSDVDAAGYYSGIIMSSFMMGRLVSSFPLGVLSDWYGRRPVIELGLWSCLLFQILFGMAPTFSLACAARFLAGATNGIVGVSKAWLPDLVLPSQQGFAMSMVAGMWGIGQVAGPAAGGLLSGVGFAKLPYLLPNLVGAFVSAISLIAVRVVLPEGGGSRQRPIGTRARGGTSEEIGSTALVCADSASESAAVAAAEGTDKSATSTVVAAATEGTEKSATSAAASRMRWCGSRLFTALGVPTSSIAPLMAYSLHSLSSIFFDEIYPLWLISPAEAGGLEWRSSEVGSLLATGGLFLAISQVRDAQRPWQPCIARESIAAPALATVGCPRFACAVCHLSGVGEARAIDADLHLE